MVQSKYHKKNHYMHALYRRGNPLTIVTIILLGAMVLIPNAIWAQTSVDLSGVNGGSIIVGNDTESCTVSKEGAIRYSNSVPISSGLVGYWNLDETSGTVAADSSGNSNNGTMTGGLDAGTNSVSGYIGTALNFDGSNDNIDVADPGNLYQTLPLTISGWFNMDQLPSAAGNDFHLARRRQLSSPWYAWTAYVDDPTNQITFEIRDTASTNYRLDGNAALSAGQWYHWAATIDASNNVILYVNGVAQTDTETMANSIYQSTDSELVIGTSNGNTQAPFDGSLDEIRIYDRALSAAEVLELYNYTGGGGCTASTQYFTTAGTTSITAPANCDRAFVEVWGGGAGGVSSFGPTMGGGGGGGAYANATITVVPGNSYDVSVGAGGVGGDAFGFPAVAAGSGGDSYFVNASTVMARGGTAGSGAAGGTGGQASSSVGDVTFNAGNGGNGNFTGGGGGGGAAGSDGAGSNASGTTGGTAGNGGGDGGDGGGSGMDGVGGDTPGGGGGGAVGPSIGGGGGTGRAIVSWSNSVSGNSGEQRIYLLSGSSWAVPTNWNSTDNSIEVIGGGGDALSGGFGSTGGGGGGYSRVDNAALTPGGTVNYSVGDGGNNGDGGDTWFCDASSNCASLSGSSVIVGAEGGQSNGTGGSSLNGIGDLRYSGGSTTNSGAGGAGGPNGNGGNGANRGGGGGGGGANASGDTGGNNHLGYGGGSGFVGGDGVDGGGGGGDTSGGGDGGDGIEWDLTFGSGGGGGGGTGAGGSGGLFGGGGALSTVGPQVGAPGIIVITYEPTSSGGSSGGSIEICRDTGGSVYDWTTWGQ